MTEWGEAGLRIHTQRPVTSLASLSPTELVNLVVSTLVCRHSSVILAPRH